MQNIKLNYPINSEGKTISNLSMRRSKVKDRLIVSKMKNSSDEEKEVSGYIYDSETTNTTPENPEVIVVGIGRYRLDSLESDIRSSLKDLADESTVNIISKITAERAVLPHKVKALDEVLKKMESPAYKRKITLAKQKR